MILNGETYNLSNNSTLKVKPYIVVDLPNWSLIQLNSYLLRVKYLCKEKSLVFHAGNMLNDYSTKLTALVWYVFNMEWQLY